MEKILDIITEKMERAFSEAGLRSPTAPTCANTSATALWPPRSSTTVPPSRLRKR